VSILYFFGTKAKIKLTEKIEQPVNELNSGVPQIDV
jgi:hypothetical protein